MHVLHLSAGNLYGGVESMLVTLARERHLCPAMEPSFALCFEGRLSEELVTSGVQVRMMGPVRFSRPWTVWQARGRLGRLLRREAFDVAVTHECWPHALFAPVLRQCGVPIVFFAHDGHGGTHWLEARARRTPPRMVACNSRWTQSHLKNLFPGVPTQVVYPPVPDHTPADRAATRHAVRAELGAGGDDVVIVQASRLERWKGQASLLAALCRLADVPGWKCWIVGGAQRPHEEVYLAELRALASVPELSGRVRFLGQRSDVPRLLAAADLHCQPNTGPEPFGIAFVEALYAGLPLVTTAMGGVLEIINETCGVLVPPGAPEAIAEALRGLLACPTVRRDMGRAAGARVRMLSDPSRQLGLLRDTLAAAAAPSSETPPVGAPAGAPGTLH